MVVPPREVCGRRWCLRQYVTVRTGINELHLTIVWARNTVHLRISDIKKKYANDESPLKDHRIIVQAFYGQKLANLPQIATEANSTDMISWIYPECRVKSPKESFGGKIVKIAKFDATQTVFFVTLRRSLGCLIELPVHIMQGFLTTY